MYSVLVGTDESGSIPLLLRADIAPLDSRMRWRLIAQTDDESLAAEVMQVLYRRCYGT